MTPIELISLDFSVRVLGVMAILWIGQKLIDSLLGFLIDRRVFSPLYKKVVRKLKIYKTKAQPVAATFSLSFTPEEDITITEAKDRIEAAFLRATQASGSKISIEHKYIDKIDRHGRFDIHYSNQTESFTVSIDLIQDTGSVRNNANGGPEEILVGSIGIEIDFKFPFQLLEGTLFNLGSLIHYLEIGFDDQFRGSFSGGRLVVSPVDTDLTIDDWVEEEKFDISLLLASDDDGQTEVEFFSDRAVVKSNQREIDAQTVKYMRELLLNYYL